MLHLLFRRFEAKAPPPKPHHARKPVRTVPVKHRGNVASIGQLMRWDPAFSVNNPVIDREHKDIIRLLNLLYEDWVGSVQRLDLEEIAAELKRTVITHFLHEEKFMMDNGCPGFDEHRAAHRVFAHELSEINALVRHRRPDPELHERLLGFARRLVIDHVMTMDHDMARYMR